MSTTQVAKLPVEPSRADFVSVQLSQLRVNAELRSPIYDSRPGAQPLLLSAGSRLTEKQLESLKNRGITAVLVHRSEVERLTNTDRVPGALSTQQRLALRKAAAEAEHKSRQDHRPAAPGWKCERDSFLHQVQKPASLDRQPHVSAQYQKSYQRSVDVTTAVFADLMESGKVNARQVIDLATQQLDEIATDLDEFVSRGLQPIAADYPSRHAVQTSMLAASMGSLMGLRREQLVELSFGCLLHDAGMLMVPARLHQATGLLSPADRLELQKHPIHAANLLAECHDVPHSSKMVVYQMHERMNGTGYPRQRQGSQIHPFARIAAVADTYLAMVSPRPFRPGLEPYQAVEKLLFATRQELFDPSPVRALLHAVSLFPIGSTVQLSDGRVGRVIRANRQNFARPIVEVSDMRSGKSQVETVDLASLPEIQVIATIGELPSGSGALPFPDPIDILQQA